MYDFKKKLKEELETSALNKTELADATAMSRTIVYQWLNGGSEPSLEALRRMCVAFGTSADEILGLTDPNEVARLEREIDKALKKDKDK